MIPEATLRIEVHPTATPIPGACAVMVDGKPIAIVSLDELRRAYADLPRLEEARSK